jgi:hypothetical protein
MASEARALSSLNDEKRLVDQLRLSLETFRPFHRNLWGKERQFGCHIFLRSGIEVIVVMPLNCINVFYISHS